MGAASIWQHGTHVRTTLRAPPALRPLRVASRARIRHHRHGQARLAHARVGHTAHPQLLHLALGVSSHDDLRQGAKGRARGRGSSRSADGRGARSSRRRRQEKQALARARRTASACTSAAFFRMTLVTDSAQGGTETNGSAVARRLPSGRHGGNAAEAAAAHPMHSGACPGRCSSASASRPLLSSPAAIEHGAQARHPRTGVGGAHHHVKLERYLGRHQAPRKAVAHKQLRVLHLQGGAGRGRGGREGGRGWEPALRRAAGQLDARLEAASLASTSSAFSSGGM